MENMGALGALDGALAKVNKQPAYMDALSALNKLAGVNETEIRLTMLNVSAKVKPISGTDDLLQKTVRSSGIEFIRGFNRLIYNNTTFVGIDFESFEDFENNITPPDKRALIYALLAATYTTLPEKRITCPHCQERGDYHLKPSDMLQEDTFKKPWDIKEKECEYQDYRVDSEIIPGVVISYGMPSETDKLNLIRNKNDNELRKNIEDGNSLLNNMDIIALYIKSIFIKGKTKKDNITITSDQIEDGVSVIQQTINGMPADIQIKIIEDEKIGEFMDYNPDFYMKLICRNDNCNKSFNWFDINPETDFFRKSLSIYK